MSLNGDPEVWLPAEGKARGVVLLTHGLNGRPGALDPLGAALAAQGFEVFRPSFSGHRSGNQEFLDVTAAQWEEDARRFHAAVCSRARALGGVPVHHVAYSMSGLIFQALRDELRFDRRVYFAPAIALHFWFVPLMVLARFLPWITFRSRIPEGYYANAIGGVRSALALYEFHRRFSGLPDGVPTLIWADPRDELVNGKGLVRLAARSPAWRFREVSTEGCTLPVRYHHLIIDEAALGAGEWKRVSAGTAEFLLG